MNDTIYLEKTDIGATLTTWLYCAMWQMFAAEKIGVKCYINWPKDRMRALRNYFDEAKFKEKPNMYDWYFIQPMFDSPPVKEKVWTWETPLPEFDNLLGQYPLYTAVPQIKDYFKKHLKFNNDVIQRGEALVSKYGIDFKNTVGVTWRGTDSIIDGRPRMPIETYFPFIDDILKDKPSLRIMCTAEEETIIEPLLKRYPSAFKIQEFFTTPLGKQTLGDNPERFSTLSGFERGMLLHVLSTCSGGCT